MRNALDLETSPYLLQHKDNPVAWQPWGTEAFATARSENKPVLLSVGYAACHWCHVMAHESFESPDIAALMNRLYVNIKVDREERPDVDTIYQHALALLGQRGGWPLTMFLTPAGEPFWGGTYFPSESRYGRPGFSDVLAHIHHLFTAEPEKVTQNKAALQRALEDLSRPNPEVEAPQLNFGVLDRVAAHLGGLVDLEHGGIRGAPKFPQCSLFAFLWQAWMRTGVKDYRNAVLVTLERMCQGGIYDHLRGGFARYSTDEQWLAPHFEKMLYDNAQLLELLLAAWQETRRPLFETRIRETIAWIEREMIAEGGGFAATIDADSEGEEGRFYVWSEAEIEASLGAGAAAFKAAYDVTEGGNWEGKTILNRSARPELGTAAEEAALAGARTRLLAVRGKRVRPAWDDKVLADWNGLMIAALANAAAAFAVPEWLAMARRAFDFVAAQMADGARLWHSYRAGRARHTAFIDDYANMARAGLALHEITGEARYLDHAVRWVDTADRHYWDSAHGGYFFTADDAPTLIVRTRSAGDNATPAGNGVMVEVLARLYYLTGESRYRERGAAVIAGFADELGRNVAGLTSLLNGFAILEGAVQIAIVGPPEHPATEALARAAFESAVACRIVTVVAPDAALPRSHPAAGKTMADGKPAAYVCVGPVCALPATEPEALRQALPRPPAA